MPQQENSMKSAEIPASLHLITPIQGPHILTRTHGEQQLMVGSRVSDRGGSILWNILNSLMTIKGFPMAENSEEEEEEKEMN